LSRKIATAQDLAGVVRSMKALAASSIGQYDRAVISLNDYYRTVELALTAVLRQTAQSAHQTDAEHASAAPAQQQPTGAIVFGSDQGLVGRFNETLLEFAMAKLKSLPGNLTRIWAVGERMHALIDPSLAGAPAAWPVPGSVAAITPLVGRILIGVAAARERGEVAEIHVFHNRPRAAAAYDPVARRLLPLDAAWRNGMAAVRWPTQSPPQIIDAAAPALEAFIRGYLFVVLFQACAESLAAENASRLAAMQRAEKNIREILDDLKGRYRRLRQESIDEELFEVVAGYESLAESSAN
jgi:F-type H+-transporting ATPase subunit gamma